MIIGLIFCMLSLADCQAQHDVKRIRVIDESKNGIEGVYVKHNDNFWHSDRDGFIQINAENIQRGDSIHFFHMSFKPLGLIYDEISLFESVPIIQMEADTKELKEVSVSAFDMKKFIQESIKKIPDNYLDPYESDLNLDAEITLVELKEEDVDEQIIDFKGSLKLIKEDKKYFVSKISQKEYVSTALKDKIFFIEPHDFMNIIPVKSHRIIRKPKKYKLDSYEFIDYKGYDAVKINFSANKRSGYLIIDRDTKAILFINSVVDKINNWIVGTKGRKGIVKTDISRYIVEAEYIQTSSGKFIFDSGRENIDSTNKWKGNTVSTSYDVYLKRNIENTNEFTEDIEKRKIKNLF